MTRRSTTEVHKGFEDPEGELRRRLGARVREAINQEFDFDLEEFFREVEVIRGSMADMFSDEEGEERMTLEQYANRPRRGQTTGVIHPPIQPTVNFGIRSHILRELKETTFSGKDDEDPELHIEEVLEIVDSIHIPNVGKDALMIRCFPKTFIGEAKRWLKGMPSGKIDTWEKLKNEFTQQFNPPAKVEKQRQKIQQFRQQSDENLPQAWERYKELIRNCKKHDLNKYQIIEKFYNGINGYTRKMLDSRGPLARKEPSESHDLIEEMAQHAHQWGNSRDSFYGGPKVDIEDKASIANQLATLARDMKKMNQAIHAIQVGCDNCSGGHLTKDCPLDEDGNQKEDVAYAGNFRDRNFKPYHEWKQDQANKYRETHPGFFERMSKVDQPIPEEKNASLEAMMKDFVDQPIPEEKNASLEAMMKDFVTSSDKRMKETEALVNRIGNETKEAIRQLSTATDVVLKNNQASIQAIENQVGQLAKTIQERSLGGFPSNTIINPNAQANAVSTGSGKVMAPPQVKKKPLVPIVEEEEGVEEIEMEANPNKVATPSTSSPPKEPVEIAKAKPYKPPIPFPQRLKKEKEEEEYRKFLDHIKSLKINIPLIEAMHGMPKYAKFMREFLSNKRRIVETSNVLLNDMCSATVQSTIPIKKIDPDDEVPIVLGRSFLSTARALVDIQEAKLTLRVEDEEVTFGIDQVSRVIKSKGGRLVKVDALDNYMEWELLRRRKELNDKEEMRAIDARHCGSKLCEGQMWRPGESEEQVFVCREENQSGMAWQIWHPHLEYGILAMILYFADVAGSVATCNVANLPPLPPV
ncbi:hypothetical protein LXL04_030783 [Taraxacum kok-saghyz]